MLGMIMSGGGHMGPVETAVRSDIDELGDLSGVEPTLSQVAIRLAAEVDSADPLDDGRALAQITRELRQTLAQLVEGRTRQDDDDGLGDLAAPE